MRERVGWLNTVTTCGQRWPLATEAPPAGFEVQRSKSRWCGREHSKYLAWQLDTRIDSELLDLIRLYEYLSLFFIGLVQIRQKNHQSLA
jgi:hypothetical protein